MGLLPIGPSVGTLRTEMVNTRCGASYRISICAGMDNNRRSCWEPLDRERDSGLGSHLSEMAVSTIESACE